MRVRGRARVRVRVRVRVKVRGRARVRLRVYRELGDRGEGCEGLAGLQSRRRRPTTQT